MGEGGCNVATGPSFKYHVIKNNAPMEYTYFWTIGAVFLIISFYFILKHIMNVRRHGNELRNELDSVFMPQLFRLNVIVTCTPLVVCITQYGNLLAPESYYLFEFISFMYQSFALYKFGQYIIYYLGGYASIMESLEENGPSQPFTVPPFGCCCKKCCSKPFILKKKHFIRIYNFILQYSLLLPVILFSDLLREANGDGIATQMLQMLKTLSNQLCFYGLGGLLEASKNVLKEYNIDKKFKFVQFNVIFSLLPSVIMGFIPVNRKNDVYKRSVMKNAYGSFITLILVSLLSIRLPKYFSPQECKKVKAFMENKFEQHIHKRSYLGPKGSVNKNIGLNVYTNMDNI